MSLSDFKGKNLVLLDFWASWCPNSHAAMLFLQDIERQYASRGLKVIGINEKEPESQVRKFLANKKLDGVTLLDERGVAGRQYDIRGMPAVVIVDKRGRIVRVYQSFDLVADVSLKTDLEEIFNVKPKDDGKQGGKVKP